MPLPKGYNKPFPTSPKKRKNFVFKELTNEREYLYEKEAYIERYHRRMEEYAKEASLEQVVAMKTRIDNFLYETEARMYTHRRERLGWTLPNIESDIRIGIEYDDFVSPSIGYRLLHVLEEWKKVNNKEKEKEWEAFTGDGQNVHTKVVSDQMNTSLNLLLSFPVPSTQKTLDEITTAFSAFSFSFSSSSLSEVYKDMKHWGSVSEIFQAEDYLYRRTLRGLWANIQTKNGELYKELVKRLWEECSEAVGLCATGHISRLTNVLVGFDEKFLPQVSIQEMFQNAMAAIGQRDASPEEKRAMARKVMDEMNTPNEERDPWLEAFSE